MITTNLISLRCMTWGSWARRAGLALLGLTLAADPATAQTVPKVGPGEDLTFTAADDFGGDCVGGSVEVCDFLVEGAPLRGFAFALGPLRRVNSQAFQYNDFEVPFSEVPGSKPDTVVPAQISGSVDIRGFLAVIGVGEATASVVLNVIDVTDDPDTGPVVASKPIASYRVNRAASASLGASMSVKGEGGFPYGGGGAGGSLSFSVGLSPQKQIVRDTVDYNLPVLLRRGQRYRLQLELANSAVTFVLQGMAISSFFAPSLGGPAIPNLLDPFATAAQPNTWLSFLEPMAKTLPNLKIPKGIADESVGKFNDVFKAAHSRFMAKKERRKTFKTDSFMAILFPGLGRPPYTLRKIARRSSFLNLRNSGLRDLLPSPGVLQTNLAVNIQDDVFELGNENRNRFIEDNLRTCRLLTSLYLPRQFGGQAEAAFAMVDYFIMRSLDAGLNVGGAPTFFDRARATFDTGAYKTAYRELCVAYDKLVAQAESG